jgi:hypothetical protein
LVPAAAAPVPPAAPPQPLPVAAAAAAGPADAADDRHPAEWQVLSPLPPDSSDDSFNDEFHDAEGADDSDTNQAADLGEDRLWLEGEVAQARHASRLETSADTGFPPSPASAANTSVQGDSPPFAGFTSPPSRSRYRPLLYPHPEEAEESEEEEGGDGGGLARGAGRGLTETHPINPERSEFTEQVAYYEALLDTVDEYTQEADRALQALQDSPPDAQLRGRERIRARSRILRDELAWVEANLSPEVLRVVQQQRRELFRPPTRGEVATGFRPTRSLQRTPPPRPGVAIADRAAPAGPSVARATGRSPGPQPSPDSSRGFQPRRTLARTPPTSSDRVLRSLPKPPPDGAPPRG